MSNRVWIKKKNCYCNEFRCKLQLFNESWILQTRWLIIRSISKIEISFIKSRKTKKKTIINAQKTTIKNARIIIYKIINQIFNNLSICHRFSFSLIMRTRRSISSRRITRRLDKKHRFTSKYRTMIRLFTRSLMLRKCNVYIICVMGKVIELLATRHEVDYICEG